jgi:hypothetical protein
MTDCVLKTTTVPSIDSMFTITFHNQEKSPTLIGIGRVDQYHAGLGVAGNQTPSRDGSLTEGLPNEGMQTGHEFI